MTCAHCAYARRLFVAVQALCYPRQTRPYWRLWVVLGILSTYNCILWSEAALLDPRHWSVASHDYSVLLQCVIVCVAMQFATLGFSLDFVKTLVLAVCMWLSFVAGAITLWHRWHSLSPYAAFHTILEEYQSNMSTWAEPIRKRPPSPPWPPPAAADRAADQAAAPPPQPWAAAQPRAASQLAPHVPEMEMVFGGTPMRLSQMDAIEMTERQRLAGHWVLLTAIGLSFLAMFLLLLATHHEGTRARGASNRRARCGVLRPLTRAGRRGLRWLCGPRTLHVHRADAPSGVCRHVCAAQ